MSSENLQTDTPWTRGDTLRSRLERELRKKGIHNVTVELAGPNEVDGPFFLRFSDDGYEASGEYDELIRCIDKASDSESLKAILQRRDEESENEQ